MIVEKHFISETFVYYFALKTVEKDSSSHALKMMNSEHSGTVYPFMLLFKTMIVTDQKKHSPGIT